MFKVNKTKCIGCGLCVKDCFVRDIELLDGKAEIKNKTCFKCGHCVAICPTNAVETDEYNMSEVKSFNSQEFEINPETFLNFIKFRRTVREFQDEKVEQEKLLKIIQAGRFTPTGSNLQNVSYTVVTEKRDELRKLSVESLKTFGENILKSDKPEHKSKITRRYAKMWIQMCEDYKKDKNTFDSLTFNAPAIIFVNSETEINGGLAACSMELMINALGLGAVYSGFLTRAVNNSEELREFLGLEENKNVVIALVVGYPAVEYKRIAPRKDATVVWK